MSADGRADLGVVIRSLVATADGDAWRYELGTGGGITVRSDAGVGVGRDPVEGRAAAGGGRR